MHESPDLWISAKPLDARAWRVTVNPLDYAQESDGPPLEVLGAVTTYRAWAGLEELDAQLLAAGYRRCRPWVAGSARGWTAHVVVVATDAVLRGLLEAEGAV